MNLEWVDEPESDIRPVSVGWLLGNGAMTDGPLVIPPHEITTFHQEAVLFNSDKSLLSICPHMHLLGKSYKVWMETPDGDSIPLVDIPQWHFEWQFYYRFLSPIHVPAGTVFKTEGVYDNTVWNPLNPNDPPIEVGYGSLTTDEMFLVYFIWADHQPGDEDLVFDTLEEDLDAVNDLDEEGMHVEAFPNPASSELILSWRGAGSSPAVIRNLGGGVVWTGSLMPGSQTMDVSSWASGSYLLSVQPEHGQRHATLLHIQH